MIEKILASIILITFFGGVVTAIAMQIGLAKALGVILCAVAITAALVWSVFTLCS